MLAGSSLPERERELVILRMGWNCRSGYEFGQHRRIGQQAGLTLEEVERVKQGPEARGLDLARGGVAASRRRTPRRRLH